MKKIAIAGASVALAAMPVVGVFADSTNVGSHVDTLSLNITSVCTLGTLAANGDANQSTDSTTHGDNTTGSWTTTTAASGATGATDTMSATVVNGQAYAGIGTTTFTVKCNNGTGYQLKAVASSHDSGDNPAATLVNNSYAIKSQTGISDLSTKGNSYWNFALSDATGMTIESGYNTAHVIPPSSATTIAKKTTAGDTKDGESVTVTYNVGIDDFQEAGTYTGSVNYTLVQGQN